MTLTSRLRYTSEFTEDDLIVPEDSFAFQRNILGFAISRSYEPFKLYLKKHSIKSKYKERVEALGIFKIFFDSITDPMDTIYFWIEKENS